MVWLLATRTAKLLPHLWQRPQDIIHVPAFILFGYYFAIMKVYALLTLHEVSTPDEIGSKIYVLTNNLDWLGHTCWYRWSDSRNSCYVTTKRLGESTNHQCSPGCASICATTRLWTIRGTPRAASEPLLWWAIPTSILRTTRSPNRPQLRCLCSMMWWSLSFFPCTQACKIALQISRACAFAVHATFYPTCT